MPDRIFFDSDESLSSHVMSLYDSEDIKSWMTWDPLYLKSYSYSDLLHIILALFQNQPMSLKFLGMKKVFELDLDVKDLPLVLQVNAEKGRETSLIRSVNFRQLSFFISS